MLTIPSEKALLREPAARFRRRVLLVLGVTLALLLVLGAAGMSADGWRNHTRCLAYSFYWSCSYSASTECVDWDKSWAVVSVPSSEGVRLIAVWYFEDHAATRVVSCEGMSLSTGDEEKARGSEPWTMARLAKWAESACVDAQLD